MHEFGFDRNAANRRFAAKRMFEILCNALSFVMEKPKISNKISINRLFHGRPNMKKQKMSLPANSARSNPFVALFYQKHKGRTFDEATAPRHKGAWRKLFGKSCKAPLNLEIGSGNGKHFTDLCLKHKQRLFLTIELRYKALAQTAGRLDRNLCQNGAVIRYDARFVDEIFAPGELDNVYILFPDPWLNKRRQKKRRLLSAEFCRKLHKLQKPGSFLELKTDSEEYFRQALQNLQNTGYRKQEHSLDFYQTQAQGKTPQIPLETLSWFEQVFFQKRIPVRQALMRRS